MSETTPETSELRDRLAEVLGRHVYVPCAEITATTRAFWAQCEGCDWKGPRRTNRDAPENDHDAHAADALLPVVAQEIAAAGQRALEDAAHEIEHSVMPSHPNAGYRDGHAHAAWVVRSLINRAAALAEPAPQEGKDGLRARIEALCVDLERSSHGGNWIRGDERRGCVAEFRAALAEPTAEADA